MTCAGVVINSCPALFNVLQNLRHHFRLRLRALRAAVVETHAHCAGFHVAPADDEHGVDFGFLGFGNLGFDGVRAEVGFGADFVRAQFAVNSFA